MNVLLNAPPVDLTLPEILAHHTRSRPDHAFLHMGARTVSYAEANLLVGAYASGLQQRGIAPGDRVVLLMANSIEQVLLWLALNRIGAVNVPLNTALAGNLLARALRLARPAALIVDVDLASTLQQIVEVAGCADRPVFVHGQNGTIPFGHRPPVAPPRVDRLAAASMLFTSGSTGVPKACVLSHHYLVRQAQIHAKYLNFRPDDVLYTPFPLFHIDAATLTVGATLVTGATAALSRRFSASRFWDEVRECDATVFNFMGATANILWKQPPSAADGDHSVRLAWGVPMPTCEPEWLGRFGFPLVEVYGLTDAGLPAYQPLDEPRRQGSCGRVIPEYQIRISDASDAPVPPGAVGEILIRSDEPGLVMNEYFDMPQATRDAFRSGWFHSGDLGRLDEEGYLYFVARGKDVIRRRGENIAATDVEQAINHHPAVRESAAVGVPSELSEDDIRAFVVPQPGADLRPEDLVEHSRTSLPSFMVPRYIELVHHLPKTPTEKIERFKLASLPLTANTFDAESPRQEGTS